ncbi:MAG: RNA polymerase sigma factor [Gemmatimonadetes bacterium]|nr:RNA polymerase sigma factor [Gemmatimonadota bacterium]
MDLEAKLAEHHGAAFGWALSCCRWDRHDAEDVLQASYVKILDGRARFAGISSFRTWLFGVIRRTAAEHRRRRALRRFLPLSRGERSPDSRGGESGAERALLRSEATERLITALGLLPARQRQVLHLVFYQDLTIAAAADVMGISLGTARTHYERGKRGLRAQLKDLRDE